MEAATAVAVIAAAPLTLSGYAHIKDCFRVSAKRVSETPTLFKDAFNSPARQLRIDESGHVMRGHVSVFVNGEQAGNYLEFNGEVLLVGEEPTELKPVASVGGATVRSHPLSISVETWEAPKELTLRFGSEQDAQSWAKALLEAAKLPHHPLRLDGLIKHICMQDMHNKDLQFRVERAVEDCEKLERQLEEVGNEKMVKQLEEKLREAHAHIQHLKTREAARSRKAASAQKESEAVAETEQETSQGGASPLELPSDRLNREIELEQEQAVVVERDVELPLQAQSGGLAVQQLQLPRDQHQDAESPSVFSPRSGDLEVLQMLESTEARRRELEERCSTLEQRLKQVVEFESEPQAAQLQELAALCERQAVELEQLRGEDGSPQAAPQAFSTAAQLQAGEQRELDQQSVEVLLSRVTEAEAEAARLRRAAEQSATAQEAQGRPDVRALKLRVTEAEAEASQLREAAQQLERQVVELEQLHAQVSVSRQLDSAEVENMQEPSLQSEQHAVEVEQLRAEVLVARQAVENAEGENRVLTEELAQAEERLHRAAEAEARAEQLRSVLEARELQFEALKQEIEQHRERSADVEALLQRVTDAEARAEHFRAALESEQENARLQAAEVANGTARQAELEMVQRAADTEAEDAARQAELEMLQRAADAEARVEQFRVALEEKVVQLENFKIALGESEQENVRLREAFESYEASDAARQSEVELQRALEEREQQLESFRAALAESDQEVLRLRSAAAEGFEATEAARQAAVEESTRVEELLQRTADAEAAAEQFRIALEEREQQLESFKASVMESNEQLQRLRTVAAESAEASQMAQQTAFEKSSRAEELHQRASEAEAQLEQLRAIVVEKEQELELFRTGSEQELAQFRASAVESAEASQVAKQVALQESARADTLQQRTKEAEARAEQLRSALAESDEQLERFKTVLAQSDQELSRLRAAATSSSEACEAAKQATQQEQERSDSLLHRATSAEARSEQLSRALEEKELQLQRLRSAAVETEGELTRHREAGHAARLAATHLETLQQRAVEAETKATKFEATANDQAERIRHLETSCREQIRELNELRTAVRERAELDKQGKQTLLQEAKAAEEMANAHLAMERRMADEAIQQRAAAEQELARLRLTLVEKETQIVQLRQESRNAKSTAQAQVADDTAQLQTLLESRDAHIAQLKSLAPEKEELQRQLSEVQAREAHLSTRFEEHSNLRRQMAEQFAAEQRRQAEQAERELQVAFQQRDVLKAKLEEAEGRLAVEGPRRAEQEVAQRLAASEQDAKGAKVRLSAAEQELLVAHQTIERQRQEYEALRSETAHAFKLLQDERSGQPTPTPPGEGSPDGGRLAAQLALVQQEKLALQEELAQKTLAYNRELEEVGRKMNSLEAALIAVGAAPKGNTHMECSSARSLTTQPGLDGGARGASGESQAACPTAPPPPASRMEPITFQSGTCPAAVAMPHQMDAPSRQILSPVQIASPTQVTSPSSVQGAPMMFAKPQQAPPSQRPTYSANVPSNAAVGAAGLSPSTCGAPPPNVVFGFARQVQGPPSVVSPLRLRSQETVFLAGPGANTAARPPSPAPFRVEPAAQAAPAAPQAPVPFGKRSAQELPRAPRTYGAQLAPPGAALHAPPSWTHTSDVEKLRMAEALHYGRTPIAPAGAASGISGLHSSGGMASFTPAPVAEANPNLRRLSFDRTASTEIPKSPLTATRVSNR